VLEIAERTVSMDVVAQGRSARPQSDCVGNDRYAPRAASIFARVPSRLPLRWRTSVPASLRLGESLARHSASADVDIAKPGNQRLVEQGRL
jgi:hypothetical protein